MTSYALRTASPASVKADALVVGLLSTPKGPVVVAGAEAVASAWGRKWRPLLATLGVTGKAGEITKLPTSSTIGAPLLVLVGLGAAPDPEGVRRAAGAAARAVTNAASVALVVDGATPAGIAATVEGWRLGGYRFTAYRGERPTEEPAPTGEAGEAGEVVVLTPLARRKEAKQALEAALVVADAVATARDWVNTPPGDLTPPAFADAVTEAHRTLTSGRGAPAVGITVYDEEQLAAMGCGGILAVGQGSAAPPRLVELTWSPKHATTHLALVGKGITFDSGGLSIKPAGSMTTMKCDMAGAATVVTALFAIARLGLPVKVTAYAPMAENMLSGRAYRPGDVVTAANGMTVEVLNTDAEGRMVLMDALTRAVATKPDVVVDVATLTGAMVVALGDRVAGVLGTDDIVDAVVRAGGEVGEPLWPMPIPEEMKERVTSSKIADLAQTDLVRWGGGLFAAAFLREFTGGLPWAHLDVAGPAFLSGGASGHLTPGGTGFGVATLVEYARSLA